MLSKPQRSFKRNRGSPKLPTSFRSPDRSRRSAEALDSFQFIPYLASLASRSSAAAETKSEECRKG